MPESFRLYLDQMFALDVAQALRREGHDVIRASEVGQARADDQLILEKAIAEKRILVTLDEHFGDWVILPLSKHPGVIRLKIRPTTYCFSIRYSTLDVRCSKFIFYLYPSSFRIRLSGSRLMTPDS